MDLDLGALGMDCSTLGINVMNRSSSPNSTPENSNDQGEMLLLILLNV